MPNLHPDIKDKPVFLLKAKVPPPSFSQLSLVLFLSSTLTNSLTSSLFEWKTSSVSLSSEDMSSSLAFEDKALSLALSSLLSWYLVESVVLSLEQPCALWKMKSTIEVRANSFRQRPQVRKSGAGSTADKNNKQIKHYSTKYCYCSTTRPTADTSNSSSTIIIIALHNGSTTSRNTNNNISTNINKKCVITWV